MCFVRFFMSIAVVNIPVNCSSVSSMICLFLSWEAIKRYILCLLNLSIYLYLFKSEHNCNFFICWSQLQIYNLTMVNLIVLEVCYKIIKVECKSRACCFIIAKCSKIYWFQMTYLIQIVKQILTEYIWHVHF